MATIKSYTDIEQSRKLNKILPLGSADMYYCYVMDIYTKKWDYDITPKFIDASNQIDICDIPCWSLAALLSVIPQELFDGEYIINITEGTNYKWVISYEPQHPDEISSYIDASSDNLIDCCVEMILKLKDRNIL